MFYEHLLFRIVGGIGENAGVDPPPHPVKAFDDDAMPICLHKFIVQ
jgi:hypothetical protein